MRIAIFTNAYHPIVSGVVTAISLFRKGLEMAGHEVAVFAPAFDDYRDDEPDVFRYRSLDLSKKVKFPVAIPYSSEANRALRAFNPDIIHTHHPFVLGWAARRGARSLGIPLVYTFHTQYEKYAHYIPLPASFVRWSARRTIRNYAKHVDVLTTPAPSVAEILKSYGISKPIHILTNPIDLNLYQQAINGELRERWGIGIHEKVLLYVGRLSQEKGLGLMLQAFSFLKNLCPDSHLRLVMVGDGPQKTGLESFAGELGIRDEVIFTGAVKYAEIPNYFQLADLFVMTSTSEVKPLVLLEAMASTLPIVAVDANGSRDTITHGTNGLLTLENHEAFAQAIAELIQDDLKRQKMGVAAGRSAEAYGLEHVTQQLISLYSDAIRQMKEVRQS